MIYSQTEFFGTCPCNRSGPNTRPRWNTKIPDTQTRHPFAGVEPVSRDWNVG